MRSSPRRPLILKRRRLPPAARDEAPRRAPGAAAAELAGAGIRVTAHPSLPRTQVVAIPPGADLRSVIEVLTAKGKGCGSDGPTKFILISGGGTGTALASAPSPARRLPPGGSDPGPPGQGQAGSSSGEMTSCALDNSLTNIQWLGRMSSDGLSPSTVKQEMEKENQTPVQVEGIKDSISERPPYSYMAMIQFAINSTEKKRMTLKDIYTWIEDHFPYFKHVAKPGWKNSIRHNLSLHDMFVRETSANGKISFWTIHPDANRYLTLDQVFKPLDAGSPTSPEHSESQQKRHISELQKNLGGSSCSKTETQNARRKMKPLLPRVNSYLVPIQFPVSQPLVLQSSVKVPLSVAQGASLNSSETGRSSKRVRIAPKILSSEEPSPFLPMLPVKEESQCEEGPSPFASAQSMQENLSQTGKEPASFPEAPHIKEEHEGSCPDEWLSPLPAAFSIKEEPVQADEEQGLFLPVPPVKQEKHFTILKSPPRGISDTLVIKRRERREMGRSRRKQRLVLPCSEEPLLVLPESSSSDSFRLASDLLYLQETQPLENMSQLSCCQEEGGPFKTPVKEMFCKLPISSTPSKVPVATPPMGGLNPWRSVPLAKENSTLDFSPVRTLTAPFTSLQENLDLLGFNSTPLKNPLFESPRELLNTESNDMVSGPLTSSPASNPESTKQLSSPELPASGLPENRSLMEGLVLDTMNDSLSKILLDISFPGLEDDNLATDISWSQLIPELR
ncbi:forkhead box protein M1 isoform X3 [Alligator mississippiensis]|uniref:forkhead box protein M1 isoform X3 n=1 Tax=Alligator mississippiensis TaxID=8496 RepID=UPI002877E3F2|nr:forkhead box protein M1 isoform X3 [Alligator mississippiensis]